MRFDLEGRRQIRAAKRQIAERLEQARVLRGLSDQQKKSIIETCYGADLQYKFVEQLGPYERRVDRFFKRGPGQLRKLKSEIDSLNVALAKLREHLATITADDSTNPSANFYLAEHLNTLGIPATLEEMAAALKELRLPSREVFERIPGHRTGADDPTDAVTKELFDFFTTECGLRKNDASQRIALIGNTLWGWNVQVRDQSDSRTPERSAAILKRLTRPPRTRRR